MIIRSRGRLSVGLLAVVVALTGCGSSSSRPSARDTERFLEENGTPNVICTKGSDGWDYTCRSKGRKIGIKVGEDGPTELSSWVPDAEPMQIGPGGEGVAVRTRFVDEASAVCNDAATMIGRLPRPVSRIDALSRMDQILDLRRQELIKLEAIKPPVALSPDYMIMTGALTQVWNDEMMLRDGIATRDASTRRAALEGRARGARQVDEIALRLGLRACANTAIPLPGIAPGQR